MGNPGFEPFTTTLRQQVAMEHHPELWRSFKRQINQHNALGEALGWWTP